MKIYEDVMCTFEAKIKEKGELERVIIAAESINKQIENRLSDVQEADRAEKRAVLLGLLQKEVTEFDYGENDERQKTNLTALISICALLVSIMDQILYAGIAKMVYYGILLVSIIFYLWRLWKFEKKYEEAAKNKVYILEAIEQLENCNAKANENVGKIKENEEKKL